MQPQSFPSLITNNEFEELLKSDEYYENICDDNDDYDSNAPDASDDNDDVPDEVSTDDSTE